MAADTRAVVALRDVLGLRGPRWTIESSLMDAAIELSDRGARYNAPSSILRNARERAAWMAEPTLPPTITEIRAALGGTTEQRVCVLARLLLAELEDVHTRGVGHRAEPGGGPPRPQSERRAPGAPD